SPAPAPVPVADVPTAPDGAQPGAVPAPAEQDAPGPAAVSTPVATAPEPAATPDEAPATAAAQAPVAPTTAPPDPQAPSATPAPAGRHHDHAYGDGRGHEAGQRPATPATPADSNGPGTPATPAIPATPAQHDAAAPPPPTDPRTPASPVPAAAAAPSAPSAATQPSTPAGAAPAAPAHAAPPAAHHAGIRLREAAETVRLTISAASTAGVSHARIALRPEALGGIEILLSHGPAGLSATVTADSLAAAHALQRAADDLQRSLADQGLSLVRLDIDVAGDRAQARGRDDHERGPQRGRDHRNHRADDAITGAAPVAATTLELSNGVLVDVLA
ncbi:MAG TPA: flagellar hook-length control protein FliK, partial [Miltoncostaea sp.]|nr:flagellar hook-length control protein FliK [Miltoncostaea sp.]